MAHKTIFQLTLVSFHLKWIMEVKVRECMFDKVCFTHIRTANGTEPIRVLITTKKMSKSMDSLQYITLLYALWLLSWSHKI